MPETGSRLALFDCDGTLIDSQHTIVAAMAAAFAALGMAAPAGDRVRRVVGLRLDLAIATLAGELEETAQEAAIDAYLAAFQTLHSDPDHLEPLYDGMEAVLDALQADGWMLGVATGKSFAGLCSTLDRHGLRARFATLQTADRAPGKPAPDMVLRAIAETGVRRPRVIVVGDTGFDIGMATNAGVASVGVGWGYHPAAELAAAGATRTADRCGELPSLLNALVPACSDSIAKRAAGWPAPRGRSSSTAGRCGRPLVAASRCRRCVWRRPSARNGTRREKRSTPGRCR